MLLRTSSYPLSQALLSSSITDGPKRELVASAAAAAYSTGYKASAAATRRITSPRLGSPKVIRSKPVNTKFRRAFSDSDLEDLVCSSSYDPNNNDNSSSNVESFHLPVFGSNNSSPSSLSSLSFHHMAGELLDERRDGLDRTVTIGVTIDDIFGGGDFSPGMGSIVEEEKEGEAADDEDQKDLGSPMYLAAGLGVDKVTCDFYKPNFENNEDMEKYYKSMIQEFPSHSLLLRNYAELLKDKGDLHGAKDYYHMATLADPGDGEILSQYAKLLWELEGDSGKADEYFKTAIQLSSQDSQVLAAYARFLWKTEDDQDSPKNFNENMICGGPSCGFSFEAAATHDERMIPREEAGMSGGGNDGSNVADDSSGDYSGGGGGSSLEEYYKRMVRENPSNPMILRNYARFLYSKGDLEGAQEYYERAILLDHSDGELLTQYANLVWELHGDEQKANSYFHRAAQIAPGDSHVLAAYASFLWSADDDEDCNSEQGIQLPPASCVQIPLYQGVLNFSI